MSEDRRKNLARADRLATKLRENLHRRKAQARAMGDSPLAQATQPLPKPPGES
jgi:hypothetical protein